MVPRLKEEYKQRVVGAMTEEFSYRNLMEVPKLQKIVISRGVGAAVADKKEGKIQKTFSEVFESDVDSQIDSFVSANGADGYEIVSETKGDDGVVKTVEITI